MGTITSGVGLVSGLNTASIIDQLMQIEARPVTLLQNRITAANAQKSAFADLVTRLSSLQTAASSLKQAATFNNRTVTSSNNNVLTASAATGAAKGTYQFQVTRLVSGQQAITSGFADTDKEAVGAGTLTVELGGGEVNSETLLSQLNGGAGVRLGQFRITDNSGRSGVVDLSAALSLDDVVKKINTSLDFSVRAEVEGDHLLLTDLSGGNSSNFSVVDLGNGHAAQDLGIANSTAAPQISGTQISYLGRNNTLASLNDGLGVRVAGGTKVDFQITDGAGLAYDVKLGGLTTVGQVLDAINTATGGTVTASIQSGSGAITLTDNSGGSSPLSVVAANGSKAASDLGLTTVPVSNVMTGRAVIGGLDTVLLSTLRGGSGLNLGRISLTDRLGSQTEVDLTGAVTMQDVIDRINNNGALQVRATLKDSGNGIQLEDLSGGVGNFVIADVNSTTASELGVAGSFAINTQYAKGANLQRQWISENTALAGYNGGRGVAAGKFTITNSAGAVATITLSSSDTKLGDVINKINAASIGVTASINANGDGLLLSDTAAGGSAMKVAEVSGRTAADLNILGTATANKLDGTFEKTISVTATDTLDSVVSKINTGAFALSASTINDGSSGTPWRLSLTSRASGRAGRFVFDAGGTRLGAHNLVDAQDSAVFFGGSGSSQPVVLTSSTNQITGAIRGVTLNLQSASNSPVTLTVGDSNDNVVTQISSFVDTFNGLQDQIAGLTKYDDDPKKRGILLGDSTVNEIQSVLTNALQSVISGSGDYRVLSSLGVTFTDGAKLAFDQEKFKAAYATDPENVKRFFTLFDTNSSTGKTVKGIGSIVDQAISKLIDPVDGILTATNHGIEARTKSFQDRIDSLNKLLDNKRTRLQTQFNNLESVLAQMQSQQAALASFQSAVGSLSSSSSKKSAA